MKKYVVGFFMAAALVAGSASMAQDKKEKEKEKVDESDEIIIKKKGDKDSKVTIEIKDGEVNVNGKPLDEFDDENISVRRRKTARVNLYTTGSHFRTPAPVMGYGPRGGSWNVERDGPAMVYINENKAFLGVTSEDADGGAKITSVVENSAAEKAGIKKGDVIIRIDDMKIDDPSDLTSAIGNHKPEDKVVITYKRDGKETKTTATLGKNKATTISRSYGLTSPDQHEMPELMEPMEGFNFNWNDNNGAFFGPMAGRPRIGIKAQDTEDGKGVKVLDVADESQADKAGIKKGDIITEFDGKAINSTEALVEAAQDSREKTAVKVKFTRSGKTQIVELKTPKKLKTTNL